MSINLHPRKLYPNMSSMVKLWQTNQPIEPSIVRAPTFKHVHPQSDYPLWSYPTGRTSAASLTAAADHMTPGSCWLSPYHAPLISCENRAISILAICSGWSSPGRHSHPTSPLSTQTSTSGRFIINSRCWRRRRLLEMGSLFRLLYCSMDLRETGQPTKETSNGAMVVESETGQILNSAWNTITEKIRWTFLVINGFPIEFTHLCQMSSDPIQ